MELPFTPNVSHQAERAPRRVTIPTIAMLRRILPFCLLLCPLSAAALADSITIAGNAYDGTLIGIRDGQIAIRIKGTERRYDLSQLQHLTVDGVAALDDPPAARTSDPKAAAQHYKQAIAAINDPEVKRLAEFRAIDPTDADGRWTEAVQLFLDVYHAHPDAAVWQGRPTHMPAAGSRMLADSEDAVSAALKIAANNDERKNLQSWLLDIYTRAGDTGAAARLATEMKTGIPTEPHAPPQNENAPPNITAKIAEIQAQFQSRQFAAALPNATAALIGNAQSPAPTGETQAQLFALQARALEGLNQPEDAAAAWLRIPAHDPTSPAVPAALLNAARVEKNLGHPTEAAAILEELTTDFPNSPEAAAAKP